ncbi:cupin domain-containing protein [Plastoroseomonas arctica]|uniref:Cupin domain-containing protein n=1 Tax=Plastoroseomonas arctica TaxID=1509237 RepID=A0AAF1JWS7_9PROT|nr:cupin domain-containing protein [Plastoroseomonas arctica]MBR0655537.1 cupin domain-containing protein [Plastoroseomonas arctica]
MRGITLAILAMLGCLGTDARAQPEARPELLLRDTIRGMPRGERQEIQVLTATIAPGQATVFHTHAFPVIVHVLEGTFTLELEGLPTAVVSAGQALVEPPNVRMTGYNRGAGPLRVLIVYVADPGTPFLHPVH